MSCVLSELQPISLPSMSKVERDDEKQGQREEFVAAFSAFSGGEGGLHGLC